MQLTVISSQIQLINSFGFMYSTIDGDKTIDNPQERNFQGLAMHGSHAKHQNGRIY